MTTTLRACFVSLATVASLLGSPAARADEAAATVKSCTGVENRQPVGEGASFKPGDTVYVWTEVTGADGADAAQVWKRDGKEFRRVAFHVGSKRWRYNARVPRAAAGAYVVEVVSGDKKLGEVAFAVK